MPIKLPSGCTKARAEELQTWAYRVWETHWKEFAPVSNSRAQFLKYVLRDHKDLDPDLMKKVELSVKAFAKHLRMKKSAGDKLIGVKTLSVWYNQGCYEDEFIDESAASLRERATETARRSCCVEGCRSETHGPAYPYCTDHLPNPKDDSLRDAYRALPVSKEKGNLSGQLQAMFASKLDQVMENTDMEDVA